MRQAQDEQLLKEKEERQRSRSPSVSTHKQHRSRSRSKDKTVGTTRESNVDASRVREDVETKKITSPKTSPNNCHVVLENKTSVGGVSGSRILSDRGGSSPLVSREGSQVDLPTHPPHTAADRPTSPDEMKAWNVDVHMPPTSVSDVDADDTSRDSFNTLTHPPPSLLVDVTVEIMRAPPQDRLKLTLDAYFKKRIPFKVDTAVANGHGK